MNIQGISVFHVRLPLIDYFEISSGRLHSIDTVLVRLEGEGEIAWGEATPWAVPIYGPETAQTVFHMITQVFGPRIVGKAFSTAADLNVELDVFRGNHFAKGAVETAFWALLAKSQSTPLYELLGGAARPVACGNSLGIRDTVDQLLEDVQGALERGYHRVKVKVRPGWDQAILERIRERFPDIPLQVDANAGYTLEHLDDLRTLDRFGLVQIEQPLDEHDLVRHARLQTAILTPICLDESIKSPDDARLAAELGSCRIVNIKVSRVGGLHKALQVHDVCQASGIPCWVGGMLESAVGQAIAAHFATLPNVVMPSDLFPSDRFYHDDITPVSLSMSAEGRLHPEELDITACEPDGVKLSRYTVQAASVRP